MSSKKHTDRLVVIDALRGLAALMVLVYHARAMLWIGARESYRENGLKPDINVWIGYLSVPAAYGWLGVTLFFVLSGYCIHRRGARLLKSGKSAEMNWRSFAVRRIWRIYPTYVAALLLTAAIDYYLNRQHATLNPNQDNSLFAFISSLLTLQGYISPFFGSNGVFWTLAMEMHLYAAYPILFVCSFRFGPNRVLAAVFLLSFTYAILEYLIGFESALIYRTQRGPIFIPYWFTWALGFYLAESEAKRGIALSSKTCWTVISISIPAGMVLSYLDLIMFAEIFWALAFAGVLSLGLRVREESLLNRVSFLYLASVGVFSYSLYAIHAPILQFYQYLISSSAGTMKFKTLWPAFGGVLTALTCAYCFYRVFESWSIRKAAFNSTAVGINKEAT